MELYPGATILPLNGVSPRIHETAFIAPGARVIGDVEIGPGASVWYNCVLRGDINRIAVGAGSNVQDGTVIHVEPELPTLIGENSLIGHMALLHGCTLAAGSFVGMGAIVMDGCHISAGGMLAAGALLPPGKVIGEAELWTGRPATMRRMLSDAELSAMGEQTAGYVKTSQRHREALTAQR
jgi:carbonic anhydrase/acetyltransferase-like protein (isoleucine patch superfamily)